MNNAEEEVYDFQNCLIETPEEKLITLTSLTTFASIYIKDNFSKAETRTAKKNDLKKFLTFLTEHSIKTLNDLAVESLSKLNDLCQMFMTQRSNAGDSSRTLRRRISTIQNFLNHLAETQAWILPVVPALKYKNPDQEAIRSSAPTITIEEWKKLKEQLKHAKNPQVRPLACLAVMGGGRTFAECKNVVWNDVDFKNNRIVIRKAQWKNELELIPELKKILKNFRGTKDPDEPLFTIHPQVMNKTLKVHARQVGIDDSISFMSFRASFIRWAAEREDSLTEVLNATLHKSTQTMRQYYDYSKQVIPVSSILKTKV